MQCLILAAGEGKRLRPLTLERPKPLVEVAGRPILDHIAEALPEAVTEIVLNIGYRGEQIREYCGDHWHGRKVEYSRQDHMLGTAHALTCARDLMHGTFLVLPGDDLHGAKALAEAARHALAILVARSDHPERFGVVQQNADGTLRGILEKPEHPPGNLVSTGAMVLDERIFGYKAPRADSGEYYLPDMLTQLARDCPVSVVEQDLWIPIGYPEDIGRAEARLAEIENGQ
jgi:bifunctional UDP-N-acetylglucosamine pyrophosphorylase/glucosamine-1-phosphate N-acetyltransferase